MRNNVIYSNTLISIHRDKILNEKSNKKISNNIFFFLSQIFEWQVVLKDFKHINHAKVGRKAKPIRLILGLLIAQKILNMSDRKIISQYYCNEYLQDFCGRKLNEEPHEINYSLLSKYRKKLSVEQFEKLFVYTIHLAHKCKLLKKTSLRYVAVDTTVQEKQISFPNDIDIVCTFIKKLGKLAKKENIPVKQNFSQIAPKKRKEGKMSLKSRNKNTKKKVEKITNKLKKFLEKLIIDVLNNMNSNVSQKNKIFELIQLASMFLEQKKKTKNKIYSVHEHHVRCIGKGKLNKKYEFGVKTGIVLALGVNIILDISTFYFNLADMKSLNKNMMKAENNVNNYGNIDLVFVDKGYRGHKYEGNAKVVIPGTKKAKELTNYCKKKYLKKRSAVEAAISNLKNYHGLTKNKLKGFKGDQINAHLSAAAYNLKQVFNFFTIFYKFIRDILPRFFYSIFQVYVLFQQ